MNGIILLIVKEFQKIYGKNRFLRILFAAIAGATMELGMLFFVRNFYLYLVLSHIMVIPVMVLVAFGWKSIAVYLKTSLAGYLAALLLGGMTTALENIFRIKSMTVLLGVLGGIFVFFGVRYIYAGIQRGKNFCKVSIRNQKNTYCGNGLWDTGNLLIEPMTQQPVHIVSADVLRTLKIELEKPAALVSYTALGNESGVIPVYQAERIEITYGKRQMERQKILLANGGENFLHNKEYQMIINTIGLLP